MEALLDLGAIPDRQQPEHLLVAAEGGDMAAGEDDAGHFLYLLPGEPGCWCALPACAGLGLRGSSGVRCGGSARGGVGTETAAAEAAPGEGEDSPDAVASSRCSCSLHTGRKTSVPQSRGLISVDTVQGHPMCTFSGDESFEVQG